MASRCAQGVQVGSWLVPICSLSFDLSEVERQYKELAELLVQVFPEGIETFPPELLGKIDSLSLDNVLGDSHSTVGADGTHVFIQSLRLGKSFEILRSAILAGEFVAHNKPSDRPRKPITLAELQSRVHPGSASSPSAKLKYRLCAPLRWYQHSILRIVATEIYSFPLRIQASLTIWRRDRGIPMSLNLDGYSLENFSEANSYLLSCTEGIRDLQKKRRFASILDAQTYFQAFQRGASWGIRNPCSGKDKQIP